MKEIVTRLKQHRGQMNLQQLIADAEQYPIELRIAAKMKLAGYDERQALDEIGCKLPINNRVTLYLRDLDRGFRKLDARLRLLAERI